MAALAEADVDDVRAALRRAASALADPLTEQWVLADVLAEADDAEAAALARRISSACDKLARLHRRLHALCRAATLA